MLAAFLWAPALAQDGGRLKGQVPATQPTVPDVATCASCHGTRGEGGPAFPRLAGTGQAYLEEQLAAFASGARKSPLMQPIAQGLSPVNRIAIARYYSALPPPLRAVDVVAPKPSETGAWLATRGRWSDGLPACAQCHGPGGSGVGANFPPLAGLPASYIAEQIQSWKSDTRPAGPLALMANIAKKLSDADVTAISAYYAGLGASGAEATAVPQGGSKVRP
jgi:cytochrome c553